MLYDRYFGQHSSQSSEAVGAFEDATYQVLAHRPHAADALARVFQFDPQFVSAHALKGLACVVLGRAELFEPAGQALLTSERLAAERDITAFERVLIDALQRAHRKELRAAADLLDGYLSHHPDCALIAKLSQSFRFMVGDREGMLLTTEGLVASAQRDTPGFGFLLGLRSFALEEVGRYVEAESVGRQAVELEPTDAWALHSVAHVFEMKAKAKEGAAWLDSLSPTWRACNNFGFHVAWHRALFDIELGRLDKVLAMYDTDVRPAPTDDFRDVSNAVSLLWRLEQEGVDVGERWQELAEIARSRTHDMSLMFAALHNLIALVASGDWTAAHHLVGAIRETSEQAQGDQAAVARQVALPLAQIILTYGRRRSLPRSHAFDQLAREVQMIGGSHAQRDVFVRTLAMAASQNGDLSSLTSVLKVRSELKERDRFERLVEARLPFVHPVMQLAPEGAAAFRS